MPVSPPQAPGYRTCKPCTIDCGIIEIQIHPGDEPCPSCGDGKRPEFTYCTPCARALRLIDEYGRTTAQCSQDTASAARPSSPPSSGAPAASCSTEQPAVKHQTPHGAVQSSPSERRLSTLRPRLSSQ